MTKNYGTFSTKRQTDELVNLLCILFLTNRRFTFAIGWDTPASVERFNLHSRLTNFSARTFSTAPCQTRVRNPHLHFHIHHHIGPHAVAQQNSDNQGCQHRHRTPSSPVDAMAMLRCRIDAAS